MNVFVTGGAGYIGSHVVRLLLEAGHRVRVYDNLSEGHRAAVPADVLFEGDLMDDARLAEALAGGFDCVMHFAAHCYVGESMEDPEKYYRNNVVGSLHLASAMRKAGVGRIVFSSTAATYGVPREVPIPEDHPQQPINAYGQTKLDFERVLEYYAGAYGLGYAALRYFNAAGAAPDAAIGEDHDPETHLVPIVLEVALGQRERVEIFGTDYPTRDGTCIRDYIHACDLAQAHVLAMEAIRPGRGLAFNLGNGSGYSVREVIEVARKVTGHAIPAVESPRRPGDPPELVASSAKITRELGWKPRFPDLQTIIETAWRWHQSHPDGYGD
ncbi:MAG TPA: UDP-glucose 4-epimerase GalE [Phycisphaerae bacterium]|nr:UDP-glucose 4-epimerase GalE [Phycisphaerae bacterium]